MLQDTATALLESREGFLWLGTREGLVRFDGATFEPFSRLNLPGFTHNEIQCLAETADGALWIGTAEPGLYRFQKGAIQALGQADGLPDLPIRRLLCDRSGTLWAAPAEGPLYRLVGSRFQALPSDGIQLRIRALAESSNGTLWVGTAGSGLWRLRQARLILSALTTHEITSLAADSDDVVWVGTRAHGLLALQEGRLEAPGWARALPSRSVSALLLDHQGSLWIGVEQRGLFRRNPAGLLEAAPESSRTRSTILSLLDDRSGALWSGGEAHGLRVIHPLPFRSIPITRSDPEEPVRAVCQDSQGTVWCLTGDHSLGFLRQGRIERFPKKGGLESPFSALWPRRAGGLWLGAGTGEIQIYEQNRLRRIKWPEGPQPDAILSLYEDSTGTLWAATLRHGVFAFPLNGSPRIYPTALGVLAMTGGGPGPLYLASPSLGLGILDSGQLLWKGRKEGLASSGAQSLHLDQEGCLWVGTPDGLRLYLEGSFRVFPERPGPLLMGIRSILEDAKGQLWLSTRMGVYRATRKALLKGLSDPGPIPLVAFDQSDGMPSREVSGGAQPLGWLTPEGDLYFPTSRGLAHLGSPNQTPSGPRLPLFFLKAESDEAVLPNADPIEIQAGTHRFEIYYTAPSLTRSEKVRFRYRLEGLETAWNEVGDRRFAAYSNLPPGTYRFALQAWRIDEEGPPGELFRSVRVEPFFYQRPLFWILIVLGAGAFGWWLLRLRLQQIEASTAVLAERNRMAREIHDHLAQGFTGVMLQLEAAEAKLTRMQGDPEPILTRIEHARNLAAASLQEARQSVMSLRPRKPEGTDLLGALHVLSDRLLAGTNIQVELAQTGRPRALGGHLEEELLRMAQEALTNALRHGKAQWVRVVLQFEGRQVCLSIADDGQGFDPSTQAAGYGLRSIRESIKQLKGHLDIDSSQGLGSRITITIPIRRWRL